MTARPGGATAAAVLAVVQSVLGAFVGLVLLRLATFFGEDGGMLSPLVMTLAEANGLFWLAVAVLYVAFAAGAWRVRPWSWWLGVLVSGVNIVYLAGILLNGGSAMAVAGLAVPVAVLGILLAPSIRQAFNGKPPAALA
jgi:hypothetical protein